VSLMWLQSDRHSFNTFLQVPITPHNMKIVSTLFILLNINLKVWVDML